MNHIRKILLTEYIGSILVALLACEGFLFFISQTVREVALYFSRQRPAYFQADNVWNRWISTSVVTAIYFLTAYLLARWLYPSSTGNPSVDKQEPEPE